MSLPWLRVDANRVVDADAGRSVLLRGVNRSGLEYSEPAGRDFLQAARISEAEIREIVLGWGANIIRLPFTQQWALDGRGEASAEDYLTALDQVIAWASAAGAYTLLDLQWLSADANHGSNRDGSVNRVSPLPNAGSIALWAMLAARYRDEPAVLYDIFNEPHDPLPDDPHPLEDARADGSAVPVASRRVTMERWQGWARQLVTAIRAVHSRSLIFVSGIEWGYDLRGMPLTISDHSPEPFSNIVYSAHVYRSSRAPTSSRTLRSAMSRMRAGVGAGPTARLAGWPQAFGHLSARVPVFVAEWGGSADDLDWGRELARYLRERSIGWTAWSWSDRPRLVADAPEGSVEATPFGELVLSHLKSEM